MALSIRYRPRNKRDSRFEIEEANGMVAWYDVTNAIERIGKEAVGKAMNQPDQRVYLVPRES